MRTTRVAAAAALPLVLAAGLASAQPAVAQIEEVTVNCIDDNVNNQFTGDDLFVLTSLDPRETENAPANTTTSICTNEPTSNAPAIVTATYADGTRQTKTINPGFFSTFEQGGVPFRTLTGRIKAL